MLLVLLEEPLGSVDHRLFGRVQFGQDGLVRVQRFPAPVLRVDHMEWDAGAGAYSDKTTSEVAGGVGGISSIGPSGFSGSS